ncbi:MAG: hypothetical protein GXP48_05560 [Acidobacteria bacterium]|nr:hypothetical protein [Acidobacteriota bacterium]
MKWGGRILARITWAVWLACVAGLALTIGAGGVLASSILFGVPAHLDRLAWLAGPRWLVATGLALQAFVAFELARISGRWYVRLSRRRREPTGG